MAPPEPPESEENVIRCVDTAQSIALFLYGSGRYPIKAGKVGIAGRSYDSVAFVWMQGERDAQESLSEVYADSF